jgi:hypothetical protein
VNAGFRYDLEDFRLSNSFTLGGVRATATRIFVWVIWAHVLLAGGVALLARNRWHEPMAVALAFALVATLAAWKLRDGVVRRSIIAVCLTFGPIIFVYAGRGHFSGLAGNGDWQIDYHMYFFGSSRCSRHSSTGGRSQCPPGSRPRTI